MNSLRKTAGFTGVLFLIAMTGSLAGAGLLEPILNAPGFPESIATNEGQLKIGVILELINGLAVLGIGILLYPVFKNQSAQKAVGYLSFRIPESFSCIIAALIPLSILALGKEIINDEASTHVFIDFLVQVRAGFAGILIPLFFCPGALILYVFLYQSKLLPRYISVWGLLGVAAIIALNALSIESNAGMLLALPIILNEIFLGIWLIAKGFNQNHLKIMNHEMSSDRVGTNSI